MDDKEQVVNYSSLNRRIIAAAVDLFILMLIMYTFMPAVNTLIYQDRSFEVIAQELRDQSNDGINVDMGVLMDTLAKDGFWYKYAASQLVVLASMAAYTLFFWMKYDRTPGKWVAGCKIVNGSDMGRPSTAQKVIRMCSYFLSLFTIIGFVMIAFTKKKEGLHDKIAGTYVINVKHDFSFINTFMSRFKKQL